MDFLDDLLNSSTLPTKKVTRLLEKDFFWQIIENSLQNSYSLQEQKIYLSIELEELVAEDVIGFQLRLEQFLSLLHTAEMWCAACIMNDETDPKHFLYFKNWLISQGKELFDHAIANPDDLAEFFDEGFNGNDLYEFEGFHLIANEVFENRFEHQLAEFIDENTLQLNPQNLPKPSFDWDEENLTNLQIICPRLFKIFIEDYSPDEDEMEGEDDFL